MPVLLQVLSMLRATKAEERRLLRVLQLRLCAMSTETDRNGMPGKLERSITRLLKRSTENNVFLFPGMNAATVRTGELLCFHFGRRPAFFFHRPSRIGQL
jgi:hypothetical protein